MQNFPTHNRDIGATIIYVNSVNRFNTFFVFTLLILLSSWTAVSYASFKLESTTVILQESEARTSFTIDNISLYQPNTAGDQINGFGRQKLQ